MQDTNGFTHNIPINLKLPQPGDYTSSRFLGPTLRLLLAARSSTSWVRRGLELGVQLKLLFWEDGSGVLPTTPVTSHYQSHTQNSVVMFSIYLVCHALLVKQSHLLCIISHTPHISPPRNFVISKKECLQEMSHEGTGMAGGISATDFRLPTFSSGNTSSTMCVQHNVFEHYDVLHKQTTDPPQYFQNTPNWT